MRETLLCDLDTLYVISTQWISGKNLTTCSWPLNPMRHNVNSDSAPTGNGHRTRLRSRNCFGSRQITWCLFTLLFRKIQALFKRIQFTVLPGVRANDEVSEDETHQVFMVMLEDGIYLGVQGSVFRKLLSFPHRICGKWCQMSKPLQSIGCVPVSDEAKQ